MRVAALQTEIVWEDPGANFARLRPWIASAAAAGARLAALPEMFACGFTMNAERVAEPVGGPSASRGFLDSPVVRDCDQAAWIVTRRDALFDHVVGNVAAWRVDDMDALLLLFGSAARLRLGRIEDNGDVAILLAECLVKLLEQAQASEFERMRSVSAV